MDGKKCIICQQEANIIYPMGYENINPDWYCTNCYHENKSYIDKQVKNIENERNTKSAE